MKLVNTLSLAVAQLIPTQSQEVYLQMGVAMGRLWTVVSGHRLYPLGDFNEFGGGFKILGGKYFFAKVDRGEKQARGIAGHWAQDPYRLVDAFRGYRRGEMPIIHADTSRGASFAMGHLCYEGASLRDIERGIGRALDFTGIGAFYRESFQPLVTHTPSLKLAKENEWRPSKHQTDHAARHYF